MGSSTNIMRYEADGFIRRNVNSPDVIDNFSIHDPLRVLVPHYIYTMNDSSGVRYVGQAINPPGRLANHLCDARSGRDKTKCGAWIREVRFIYMDIVEKCTASIVTEREDYWLHFYYIQKYDLVNSRINRRVNWGGLREGGFGRKDS